VSHRQKREKGSRPLIDQQPEPQGFLLHFEAEARELALEFVSLLAEPLFVCLAEEFRDEADTQRVFGVPEELTGLEGLVVDVAFVLELPPPLGAPPLEQEPRAEVFVWLKEEFVEFVGYFHTCSEETILMPPLPEGRGAKRSGWRENCLVAQGMKITGKRNEWSRRLRENVRPPCFAKGGVPSGGGGGARTWRRRPALRDRSIVSGSEKPAGVCRVESSAKQTNSGGATAKGVECLRRPASKCNKKTAGEAEGGS